MMEQVRQRIGAIIWKGGADGLGRKKISVRFRFEFQSGEQQKTLKKKEFKRFDNRAI